MQILVVVANTRQWEPRGSKRRRVLNPHLLELRVSRSLALPLDLDTVVGSAVLMGRVAMCRMKL